MPITLRPEDFPFEFRDDQRALATRFVENNQAELKSRGQSGLFRVRVTVFRRTIEAWAERDPKTGKLRFACECPHLENTGNGCAHLYALCLLLAHQNDASSTVSEPSVDSIRPLWVIPRERSHGRRALVLSPSKLGADGVLQPLRVTSELLAGVAGDDERILRLLAPSAGGRVPLDRGGGFAKPDGPLSLEDDALIEGLPILLRTGRLHLQTPDKPLSPALADDLATPFEFVMALDPAAAAPAPAPAPAAANANAAAPSPSPAVDELALRGCLIRDGVRINTRDVDLAVTGRKPFFVHGGKAAWIDTFDAGEWLAYLLRKDGPSVPTGDVDAFLTRLASGGALPRLMLPGAQAPIPVELGTPVPMMLITRDKRDIAAAVTFRYAGETLRAVGASSLILDAPNRRQLKRDVAVEERALERVKALGAIEDPDRYGRMLLPVDDLDTVVSSLLAEGFEVLIDGRAQRRAGAKRVILKSGIDWFELSGDIAFGEESVPLTQIFDAVRKGRQFIELKDGSAGLIPAEWIRRWQILDDLAERKQGALRLHASHGLLLESLIEDKEATIEVSQEALDRLHRSLASLRELKPIEVPRALHGELRPYQRAGLDWLCALDGAGFGGCLADDMGLGKTVQVIALLLKRRESKPSAPSLVVVPRSLVFNWMRELERFAPTLRVLEHAALDKIERSGSFDRYDVVVTTYGIVRRDIEALEKTPFDWAILDESQAIKNSGSQNARAAFRLKARRRLAMTGTPIENRPEELWSQFRFLNPGLLGKETDFARLARGTDTRPVLARIIRPLLLRRTKEEVARDLPELIEMTVWCDLSPEQAALYSKLAQHAQADLSRKLETAPLGALRMQVLEALLRLRQTACHAGLVDPALDAAPSGKLDALAEEIDQVIGSGHKALVFSQFVTLLTRVRASLDAKGIRYAYLDGSTRDREAPVKQFQEDPSTPLLLVSLMAGGHGLNLTAADYVFLLDPWWNPAVEAQAVARAHRIGRTRPVVAIRLVSRGTVEEKILTLQDRKRDLADQLLATEPSGSALADLTVDDLMLLFS